MIIKFACIVFLLFLCKNMIFRYNQVVSGPELTEESDKFISGQIWQDLLTRVIILNQITHYFKMIMKDSFIKRRCDKHFLKRWVQGLGSTWTLTKFSLCGTCAGDKYKYKYKCAMWTISSEGDEWTPNVSTRDVNKVILKIRAGLGSIEELTLVRPFHSRWPRHLQL